MKRLSSFSLHYVLAQTSAAQKNSVHSGIIPVAPYEIFSFFPSHLRLTSPLSLPHHYITGLIAPKYQVLSPINMCAFNEFTLLSFKRRNPFEACSLRIGHVFLYLLRCSWTPFIGYVTSTENF